MDSTSPAKRQRTDTTSLTPGASTLAVVRSDVWYDDGNIILQTGAGTPDSPVAIFRIHRSVLASRSSVFKDMFMLAQPGGERTVDGCPIIHLTDDRYELEHVLRAMYGEARYFKPDQALEFSAVAGFVRLGAKYDIPTLRTEGLSRLTYELPTTLAAYNQVYQTWTKIAFHKGLPFDILNLAHDCGISHILPAAYLACTSRSFLHIVEGLPGERPGSRSRLSAVAMAACIQGKQGLLAEQYHVK